MPFDLDLVLSTIGLSIGQIRVLQQKAGRAGDSVGKHMKIKTSVRAGISCTPLQAAGCNGGLIPAVVGDSGAPLN